MPEIYFAPTKRAVSITLEELQQRFKAAGLPCKIEPDSPETHWLVFAPHASTIFASTKAGKVVLATLELAVEDGPELLGVVERVMEAIAFSADEEEDYE